MTVPKPTAPKPQDPRARIAENQVKPAEIDQKVAEILSEEPQTLRGKADQLARAHQIVHNALQ